SFDSVYKSYGEKVLLENLNVKIYRNDCIALAGANGCGKTTLLKMIMNEEQSDSGTVKLSSSARPAYMPQIVEFENEDDTILETLRFQLSLSEEKARSILAGFHFKAGDVIKKVGSLSGGEKSRLKLCLLMQSNINFLLLDEPTNHLDIESREWIENALSGFNGTMLFVSHDRYFLKKFATQIWGMDNGIITKYDCGVDEYLERIKLAAAPKKVKTKSTAPKEKVLARQDEPVLTETLINEAEAQLKEISNAVDSALFESDYIKASELYEKKCRLERRIDLLYNEWLNRT
ncbi:MAG: ATP-binding cassette domain-containing protein, partial [Clostridiales bacterium]|nr:ATP-binding cassette domain-containing protein [Clostridiales bacterium]